MHGLEALTAELPSKTSGLLPGLPMEPPLLLLVFSPQQLLAKWISACHHRHSTVLAWGVHDFQPTQRHHHPSGPGEMRATVTIGGSFHPAVWRKRSWLHACAAILTAPGNLILKVISYLMRGLQSEQIEVSQQVVLGHAVTGDERTLITPFQTQPV